MNRIRLLLAHDHAVVREGLRSILKRYDHLLVVGEAAHASEAEELALDLRPDIVLLGHPLPPLSGVEATRRVRNAAPEARVLIFTAHESSSAMHQAFEAGALGYLLSRATAEVLLAAIGEVAQRRAFVDARLSERLLGQALESRSVTQAVRHSQLSQREQEVLRLIALGYGGKEIASRLAISIKTVETYKTRCLEKLGILTRAEIVRYAIDRGWLSSAAVEAAEAAYVDNVA